MRKHIKLFFCGLTLTLMTIPSTSAQEFIREFYSLKDWKTIIREIQQDEWLLYRNYEDIRSAFCIVTPSGTSSPMLWFTEQMSFRDFEILDGKHAGERQHLSRAKRQLGGNTQKKRLVRLLQDR